MRIISTVPSITELLCDLGLEQHLVGITKFCEHPDGLRKRVKVVGGTKYLRVEAIRALKPDLCIANREENVREQIEEIGTFCKVMLTEIRTVDEALSAIAQIAERTKTVAQSEAIMVQISAARRLLHEKPKPTSLKTLYLIWRDPYMSIGSDTFIHAMMHEAGLQNICGQSTRYPSITEQEIAAAQPDLILLSSEPYPFKAKHIAELQALCPQARILLADGQAFSWYGSRMIAGFGYLCRLVDVLNAPPPKHAD